MSEWQPGLFGDPPDPPETPPSSGITRETREASEAAAEHIEPNAETLRAEVLAFIRGCGDQGATDDEIQTALDMPGNTERPRRWELYRADFITTAGHRENARGRRCAVWVAVRPDD
jgi:hypothetical protein